MFVPNLLFILSISTLGKWPKFDTKISHFLTTWKEMHPLNKLPECTTIYCSLVQKSAIVISGLES